MIVRYITLDAIFICLSVMSGIYYQMFFYGTLAKLLSLFFGCLAIAMYIFILRRRNKPFVFWFGVLAYMFLVGITSANTWPEHSYTFVRLDFASIVFISIGFIFADSCFDEYREIIFKLIIVCALIAGVVSLLQVVRGDVSLTDRYATISENNRSYVLWGMLCNIFAYSGYSAIFSKEWRMPKIAVVVLYGILGLFFQKRSIIVNVLMIIIVGIYFYNKRDDLYTSNYKKFIRTIFIICGFAVVAMLLIRLNPNIQTLFDNTFSRLTSAKLDNYDRSREANQFLEQSGFFRTILGYGIGYYYVDKSGLLHGMLHIGYYNILYKGGVLYAAFWFYVLLKTVSACWQLKRLNAYSVTCLCITLSVFVSLTFEFSWGETILPFCYMPFIGHICMLTQQVENQSEEYL